MSNHKNIFSGTFGIIFSSKHSRACNQSIGSSLNHLSIKIILKIGSYNSNGLILLLCLVESILIQWIKKNDLLPHYLFWIPCSIQKLEHFTKNSGIHKVEVHDQICMSHQLFPNILCWVHSLKKGNHWAQSDYVKRVEEYLLQIILNYEWMEDNMIMYVAPCKHLLDQLHHLLQSMDSLPEERENADRYYVWHTSWGAKQKITDSNTDPIIVPSPHTIFSNQKFSLLDSQ